MSAHAIRLRVPVRDEVSPGRDESECFPECNVYTGCKAFEHVGQAFPKYFMKRRSDRGFDPHNLTRVTVMGAPGIGKSLSAWVHLVRHSMKVETPNWIYVRVYKEVVYFATIVWNVHTYIKVCNL